MRRICVLIFLMFIFSSTCHAHIQDGLVAWWKMDEGSGTTTADSSGQGKTGSFSGSPAWISGYRNKALKFSGGSSLTFSNITTTSTFTFSAWINPTGVNATYNSIIVQDNTNGLWFVPGSGFTWEIGGTDHFSSASVSNNIWSHVALVVNGGSATWYINSAAQGTAAGCTGFTFVEIGDDGVGSDVLEGSLDDVRIYNRALSAQEITYLYSNAVQIKNAVIKNAKINN